MLPAVTYIFNTIFYVSKSVLLCRQDGILLTSIHSILRYYIEQPFLDKLIEKKKKTIMKSVSKNRQTKSIQSLIVYKYWRYADTGIAYKDYQYSIQYWQYTEMVRIQTQMQRTLKTDILGKNDRRESE